MKSNEIICVRTELRSIVTQTINEQPHLGLMLRMGCEINPVNCSLTAQQAVRLYRDLGDLFKQNKALAKAGGLDTYDNGRDVIFPNYLKKEPAPYTR